MYTFHVYLHICDNRNTLVHLFACIYIYIHAYKCVRVLLTFTCTGNSGNCIGVYTSARTYFHKEIEVHKYELLQQVSLTRVQLQPLNCGKQFLVVNCSAVRLNLVHVVVNIILLGMLSFLCFVCIHSCTCACKCPNVIKACALILYCLFLFCFFEMADIFLGIGKVCVFLSPYSKM